MAIKVMCPNRSCSNSVYRVILNDFNLKSSIICLYLPDKLSEKIIITR